MQYWIGDHCNRRPASDYVKACAELDVDVIRNALDIERQDADPAVVDELLALGFSREELFASQHVFVARKPG